MLGFSLYPHHLSQGSDTSLSDFCQMAARTAEIVGPRNIGIGSDLCQGQPDSVVRWMRDGRWTRHTSDATFPAQPAWFRDNRDWDGIADGLRAAGFAQTDVDGILGENWLRFWEEGMRPQ
jgi:microsomal dipeptidase-like Zn-dependent dipeptidase